MKQANKLVAVITLTFIMLSSAVATAADRPKSQASHNFLEQIEIERTNKRIAVTVERLMTRDRRTPYVFSGSKPNGWDCSGMTRWFYKQLGLTIPHSADKQAHLGVRVSNPAVGDIVAFAHKGSTDFYHVGLYIGDNKIINANRYYGTTVVESLSAYKRSQIRFIHLAPLVRKLSQQ